MSNTMNPPRIVLVTGAGSGIGRAVATTLAQAGDTVYAGMRDIDGRNRQRAVQLAALAAEEGLVLHVLELDVLSETSCRSALDQLLLEQGRIDVVVNNAGMLMSGVTEAFTPGQVAQVIDTNALSWLRVNRAALPAMRRQGGGTLVYIGSTTSRIHEPFLGPYVASKAAGDALAEVMGLEVRPFGIDSIIVAPGAFTQGTEHFNHAQGPADGAVLRQYGALPRRAAGLPARLDAIDAACGGALDVAAVGIAVREVLALAHGRRPARITVDAQQKGVEELDVLHQAKQAAFLTRMGLEDLLPASMRR
ncbi:SDR family NAD(P)-dependent oxidoreductase [Massilia sp. G4R7]|uniref:SDR family NAD(P)-dependent oxidoreductase n=1 Tax=Massilia phyllostachyos TaxID=2898585 RepID=A0ABS8QAT0_9BURK|nr:SDR family NAD(P)-dependent oxidoreductase [Massilia phyllostachyos]MCD2518856.1 SDR family NAD(P)-dependent oxidoreductase [Massilia phyllostachyos]